MAKHRIEDDVNRPPVWWYAIVPLILILCLTVAGLI